MLYYPTKNYLLKVMCMVCNIQLMKFWKMVMMWLIFIMVFMLKLQNIGMVELQLRVFNCNVVVVYKKLKLYFIIEFISFGVL